MSLKILTVDDSKTIRLIIAKALKPYDCQILEAPNGLVGLATASREKPDIIILDYTMPVMDGFEVLARLRSDPDLKSTPVIMLTAEAGRETVIKIAKLGVRDYLIKPFKEELLIERVGRVVTLKPKSDEETRARRFDDPISILVVDDKPAIVDQIRAGLADTPWKITSADQQGQALDICMQQAIDVVLASLALPKDGAYMLFQNLRALATTASIPVLGLCVKTALEEQAKAQQTGFTGVVTKPIDCQELKGKISRALKLETSYKYFHQKDGILVLTLPKNFDPGVAMEIASHLNDQMTGVVEAGGDKTIIDITQIETTGLPIIELVVSAIQACNKLSLKHAVVSTASVKDQCRSFEDSQSWIFAKSLEEATSILKGSGVANTPAMA
jgi:two-component system cell cycle response regulator